MGYVDTNLEPGERIVHRAYLHWMIYWPAIAAAVVALVSLFRHTLPGFLLMIFLTALLFLIAKIRRSTTEIAVTNHRVIQKHGIISRNTIEINIPQVESVDVSQPALGTMLDYGTVIVRGTGGGFSPLRHVSAPLQLRRAVQLAGRTSSTNTSPGAAP